MQRHISTIASTLKRIQTEGGDGNFAIFELSRHADYYIQLAGESGTTHLYGEVSALTETAAQDEKLIAAGWAKGEYNYYREWQASTDGERQAIAEFVTQTFADVYGLTDSDTLNINLNLE